MGRLIVTYPPIEGEVHFGPKAKMQGARERVGVGPLFSSSSVQKHSPTYSG